MSIVYDGAHSIIFRKYTDISLTQYYDADTWAYFHMVPAARPYIVLPEPRITLLNIPRSNTILDLTNALTNDVTYNASEGDWEFYIDHDKWTDWSEAFDAISEFFDGSVFDVWLSDQLNYSYRGRVYANSYRPGEDYSRINLHYSFDVNLYDTENPYDGISPTPGPEPTPTPSWVNDFSTTVDLDTSATVDGSSRMISESLYYTYNSNASSYRVTLTYNQQVPITAQTFYLVKYANGAYTGQLLSNEYTGSDDKIVASVSTSFLSDSGGVVYLSSNSNFHDVNIVMDHYI